MNIINISYPNLSGGNSLKSTDIYYQGRSGIESSWSRPGGRSLSI
jgi:hypothetical protein